MASIHGFAGDALGRPVAPDSALAAALTEAVETAVAGTATAVRRSGAGG
jgi:hypothetical protein